MIKFTPSNVTQMEDEMIEVLNKYGFKNVTFSGNTRSVRTKPHSKLLPTLMAPLQTQTLPWNFTLKWMALTPLAKAQKVKS